MKCGGTRPNTDLAKTSFKATTVIDAEKDSLIATYMHLTKEVLPSMARSDRTNWPVSEDHCFQRIILDQICGGVWYKYLGRPAYKHLTKDQAQLAVKLCRGIIEGREDLRQMNQQSLIWRDKHRADWSDKRFHQPTFTNLPTVVPCKTS